MAMLLHEGIECRSPRSCIKEGYQQGTIRDGDGQIAMLEDRNRTSHLYDEQEAQAVYRAIVGRHVALFDALAESAPTGLPAGQ